MARVVVNVETSDKVVDAGTPDEQFLFSIAPADPASQVAPLQQKQTDLTATFADVSPGDWVATVSKLGVDASMAFTVAADSGGNTVRVPASVAVTVG